MIKTKKLPKRRHVKRVVDVDAFGNAIPARSSVCAGRVVKQAEIITAVHTESAKNLSGFALDLLEKVLNDKSKALVTGKPASKTVTEADNSTALEVAPPGSDTIDTRLEHAFTSLHHEFNRREQQLEIQMEQIKAHHKTALESRSSLKRWTLPLVIAGAAAGGYMLYVLTNMQNSMNVMTTNITAMNDHMESMSRNVQTMNGSMANLNGNVAYMNQNVAVMNHQIGTISRAAAPMGDMAKGIGPFAKMFSKFMPF